MGMGTALVGGRELGGYEWRGADGSQWTEIRRVSVDFSHTWRQLRFVTAAGCEIFPGGDHVALDLSRQGGDIVEPLNVSQSMLKVNL